MPVAPILRGQRQEDYQLYIDLNYIGFLKKKKKSKNESKESLELLSKNYLSFMVVLTLT